MLKNKNTYAPLLSKRRIHIQRCPQVMRRAVLHDGIDPSFLLTYISNVCNMGGLDDHDTRNCIASFVVPPLERQFEIMRILRQTSKVVDIQGILGPAMSLLVQDDIQRYEQLINAYIQYQLDLQQVRDLVTDALPLWENVVDV